VLGVGRKPPYSSKKYEKFGIFEDVIIRTVVWMLITDPQELEDKMNSIFGIVRSIFS
jgi:ribose 5-phosphate isomerase